MHVLFVQKSAKDGDILVFCRNKVMELDVSVNTLANLGQPRHSQTNGLYQQLQQRMMAPEGLCA